MRHGAQDPLTSFKGVWPMTQEPVARLGVPAASTRAEVLYRTYTQLCWAKHGPPFTRSQSYTQVGPDIEGNETEHLDCGDSRGARLRPRARRRGSTFVAGAVFAQHHVPGDARPALLAELRAIDAGPALLGQGAGPTVARCRGPLPRPVAHRFHGFRACCIA